MNELPHSEAAERAVIGSVLIDNSLYDAIRDILASSDFYSERHRAIWSAIEAMEGSGVDLITLGMRLEQDGAIARIGGAAGLSELVDGIPDIASAPRYAQEVKALSCRRRVALEAQRVYIAALRGQQEEIAHLAGEMMEAVEATATVRGVQNFRDLAMDHAKLMEERMASDSALVGVDTGYPEFNSAFLGWRRGMLHNLAARFAVGKSALALNFLYRSAKAGARCIYFNLEMTNSELTDRLVSLISGVDGAKIQSGKFISSKEWELIGAAHSEIARYADRGLAFDFPRRDRTIREMRNTVRRLARVSPLDLVIVDYVGIFEGIRGKDTRERIDEASGQCLEIAKEFDCAVLVLAQVNRSGATDAPESIHLKDSDKLGADASTLTMLDRPGFRDESVPRCRLDAYVRKNRHGESGQQYSLHYNLRTQEITERGSCFHCNPTESPRLPVREEKAWTQSAIVNPSAN